MAFSRTGYESFRLRQLTGIPLSRICEVASEIAYNTLRENPELLNRTIEKYSIRSPARQLEIDLKKGYEKVAEILGEFEIEAARDIKLDKDINADPYESIGRYKLIQKIKKRMEKSAGRL
jgi:hypothetical protein